MANRDGKTFGWDPRLYLRFQEERNQPIRDLLARLGDFPVSRALDVGCGPGNSTGFLVDRWPGADIIGLDYSAEMLAQARQSHPQVHWLQRDAGADMADLGRFDLVFSNAALQWIPRHEIVIPHLFSLVNPGGAMAVQVPNSGNSAMHQAIRAVVTSSRWRDNFPDGFREIYDSPEHYYRILSGLDGSLAMWETIYYHVMESVDDIVSWFRGSQLRQYLSVLAPEQQVEFLADIREPVAEGYPVQPNGKVLFPFRRLLFVIRK